MELLCLVLFVWVLIIQLKLNELNSKVNSKIYKNHDNNIENSGVDNGCENIVVQSDKILQEYNNNQNNDLNNNETISNVSQEIEKPIREERKKSFDIETAILGNIFNKIGAIAIIIGIIIFIKIVSTYIVFTPTLKIAISYISSILLLIFGYRMNEEKMAGFKETLLGTGISVGFITTYCASAMFHLFSPAVAAAIATIILLFVYILADKRKSISMIVIALIAGYLNPLLTNVNVSCEFLFGYYLFINLLSIIFVYRNPKKDVINFVNLFLTFSVLSVNLLIKNVTVNILYPLLLWGIYLVYDLIRMERKGKVNILNWSNFIILTIFTLLVFREDIKQTGFLLLFAGLLYLGIVLVCIKKESKNYLSYTGSAILAFFISTLFLSSGVYRIGFWCLEAVVLNIIANKTKLKELNIWSMLFTTSSVVAAFKIMTDYNYTHYHPIRNIVSLGYGLPILSSFISYKLINKMEDSKTLSNIFRFLAVSLIYVYVLFEVNSFMSLRFDCYDEDFISVMLTAVICLVYSIQTKYLYNLSKFKLFNFMSYFVGYIAIFMITIGCFDDTSSTKYFYLTLSTKVFSYIAAIIWSIFYSKITKYGFYNYLAATLGFFLVHIVTSDFVSYFHESRNIEYLITVSWLLYAGSIILYGIFKNVKFLRNTGIWISMLTIFRIFIFDLADTDLLYKLVAFLTLGITLMIVSYFYNKIKNKE